MNSDTVFNNKALQKAAATFASGYAKRMMEGRYNRFKESEVGQQLFQLSSPSKYTIEAVLNGIVAYLATKESTFANTPIRQFLWEVAKDAPSEISKRLLNGEPKTATSEAATELEAGSAGSQAVLDHLLRMDADKLGTFLSWLEKATPEERSQMAGAMARLTEDEQRKLMTLQQEQVKTLLTTLPKPGLRQKVRPPEVQADLDAAHRRLDEELRRLNEKAKE